MRSTRVRSGRVATTFTLVLLRPASRVDREHSRVVGQHATEGKAVGRAHGREVRREAHGLHAGRRARREIQADSASVSQLLALVLPRLSIEHPHDQLRRCRQLEPESRVERDWLFARQPEGEQRSVVASAPDGAGDRTAIVAARTIAAFPGNRSTARTQRRSVIPVGTMNSIVRSRSSAPITASVGNGSAASGRPEWPRCVRVSWLGILVGARRSACRR